ncbi:protein kinase family protein [Streptomyces sp. NPDC008317]|uniref:protein kinase family protein n=1 Tax=Streptomyces sp. NPDC008317 TaxID=3364827 RepID=UPI0036EE7990
MKKRTAVYGEVATELALRSDAELRELVERGEPLGEGIGGQTSKVLLAGTPVFVKEIRLTDLERRPENTHSTANVFDLPAFCHYGIATPGFGAWRELAVHAMTTNWVLAGEHDGFPMTYHWRVLPSTRRPLPKELADVEAAVAYWGGSPGMRRRIEGVRDATASVVVFMEYIPQNLQNWLRNRLAEADEETTERVCERIERELLDGAEFMNDRELLHFDAHFENILTDGHRLYFADYGLAVSTRFELSSAEAEFYERHRTYDRDYIRTHLVRWLERNTGKVPAPVLARHGQLAEEMGEWHRALQTESRETPYPVQSAGRHLTR